MRSVADKSCTLRENMCVCVCVCVSGCKQAGMKGGG